MKKTILAVILAATSFGSFAATSDNLTFTATVPATCGIAITDGAGTLLFKDDTGPTDTEFTLSSNVADGRINVTPSITTKGGIDKDDVALSVAGGGVLTDSSTVHLGAGEYKARASVNTSKSSVAAGVVEAVVTLEVSCK
jgi:hypothetical protein